MSGRCYRPEAIPGTPARLATSCDAWSLRFSQLEVATFRATVGIQSWRHVVASGDGVYVDSNVRATQCAARGHPSQGVHGPRRPLRVFTCGAPSGSRVMILAVALATAGRGHSHLRGHTRCINAALAGVLRPIYKPRGQRLAWTACAVGFVHSGAASAIYNVRSTINERAWWC